MKPRVLFASQSVHEKQVGSEEDKAELILLTWLKARINFFEKHSRSRGKFSINFTFDNSDPICCVRSRSKEL